MLKGFGTAFGTVLALTASAGAQEEVELPSTLTMTSADVGGTAYNQAIAIGKALQDEYGTSVRVIGTGNPQAKLAPVRDGRMPFSLAGSEVFFAFEGVGDYATAQWGPQRLRAVSLVGAENCLTYVVAGDAGIETMDDFEGVRVPWVVGSGALQSNATAMLAFAGLTTDDVTLVEMPSYGAAIDALIANQVDVMSTVSSGGLLEAAVAGPRGVKYMAFPHDDDEGWARLQEAAPQMSKRVATLAAGGLDEPLECIGVPYPDLITYSEDDADRLVYSFTKALDLLVDTYSKADPSTSGFAADKQMFEWTVPYHPAAIEYYVEAGVWTDALQAHNNGLLERREVLTQAWEQMEDKGGDDFTAEWMQVRAEALEAADMPVYFR